MLLFPYVFCFVAVPAASLSSKTNVILSNISLTVSTELEKEDRANKSERVNVDECISGFMQIFIEKTPLLSTQCCLTNFCSTKNSNRSVLMKKRIIEEFPKSRELLVELCSDRVYLFKEKLSGCVDNYRNESFVGMMVPLREMQRRSGGNEKNDDKAGVSVNKENLSGVEEEKSGRNTKIKTAGSLSDGLQFLDVPRGDEMHVHDLRLADEYLIFEAFSALMAYLQPGEFPADLVREAFKSKLPLHVLVFQILKMEFTVIAWIVLWAVLALSLPFLIISYFCCSKSNLQRLTDDVSSSSLDFNEKCTERTLGFLMHFLLILLLIPIILILVGNEQISKQMNRSLTATSLIFQDLNTFVLNTHMQITFVATSSTDITVEAIRSELEETEELLGRPYRNQLATETGIDTALDALDQLKLITAQVTSLVLDLIDECKSAEKARSLLQEQLSEISRQLASARQQCRPKDRVLCYTLQYARLEVVFSCGNITDDLKIRQLESIGRENNFNKRIETIRKTFQQLPQKVSTEAVPHISELKSVLNKKRSEIYKSAHALDELARSLSTDIARAEALTAPIVEAVAAYDVWRWLAIAGICGGVALIWGLLLCGAPCGCGMTSKTISLLIAGVGIACLLTVVMWLLGTVAFLFGVHAETGLCQPLYDQTREFSLLEDIFTSIKLFEKKQSNNTLKIADVLKNCQRNQPAYATFHLQHLLDVHSLTNHTQWPDFHATLNLQVLSTITGTALNLTKHRTRVSGPVTRRDLNSFADQMNTVARQLTDLASSQRFDNIASGTRRIVQSQVSKLGELRDRIVYKITALEVLVGPLSRAANQSLGHLKSVQYFIDNQAWQVAESNTRQFASRLEKYLDELHNYVVSKVTKEIGKCRALWEIFHSARFCICKLVVDPANGISLASFWIVLMFLGIAPVIIKLIEHYRELNEELLTSITHRRSRDGAIIDDEGTWATPSYDSPENQSRNNQQAEWASPSRLRQPSEPLIPPPPASSLPVPARITSPRINEEASTSRLSRPVKSPKRLSTIASRISAARVSQIPSVSRARTPKSRGRQESMRLVEPICWKSGSLSPRSWI